MRKVVPKSPSHAKSDAEVTSKSLQSHLRTPKSDPKVTQSDPQFTPELYKIVEFLQAVPPTWACMIGGIALSWYLPVGGTEP